MPIANKDHGLPGLPANQRLPIFFLVLCCLSMVGCASTHGRPATPKGLGPSVPVENFEFPADPYSDFEEDIRKGPVRFYAVYWIGFYVDGLAEINVLCPSEIEEFIAESGVTPISGTSGDCMTTYEEELLYQIAILYSSAYNKLLFEYLLDEHGIDRDKCIRKLDKTTPEE